MPWVQEMLQPEIKTFRIVDTQLESEGRIYKNLVAARHKEQRNRYMDDLALQVWNAVMGATDLPAALTEFICNIEAPVFADMQSAPRQELNNVSSTM